MSEEILKEIAKKIVDLKSQIATTRCCMCNGSNYLEWAYLSDEDRKKNIQIELDELKQLISEAL